MFRIMRYLSKAEIGQMLIALVSIVGQIWFDWIGSMRQHHRLFRGTHRRIVQPASAFHGIPQGRIVRTG